MEQYTLLIMEENKVVKTKVFITMRDLLNYKRYYDEDLKNIELKQVDKYGYVWFYEF